MLALVRLLIMTAMGRFFITMTVLLCSAMPAWADSGRGLLAYQRGDFSTAFYSWQSSADLGDRQSQLGLGVLYYNGQGVAVDYGLAVTWFTRAAEQGVSDAQFNLGIMYAHGLGVERNEETAKDWIVRAAVQGHSTAIVWLDGSSDVANRGTTVSPQMRRRYEAGQEAFEHKDYEGALTEWKQLAVLGMARAQNSLGVMYDQGIGVAEDRIRAAGLFRDAASQGFGGAQVNLGVMYLRGRGVTQDHRTALDWLTRAAEQGYVGAQYQVGLLYATGVAMEHDFGAAAKWYAKAAKQGHVKAQYNLGVLLDNGQGVRQNQRVAADWYRKAALAQVGDAQFNIGAMRLAGDGVKQDPARAHAWFSLASYIGNLDVRNRAIAVRAQVEKDLNHRDLTRARVLAYRFYDQGNGRLSSKVGRALVLAMQAALAVEGFDPGPIDGEIGPRTRTAAESFMAGNPS